MLCDTKNTQQRTNGFTLIELLVVVSIIALLISILMPALSRAREQANKVVCMANVRRLAISMQLYLDDNGDVFPPDRVRDSSMSIQTGPWVREKPRWIWFLNEGMGFVINPYKYQTQEAFQEALEMDNDHFICPSFKHADYLNNIRNGAYGFNFQYLSSLRPHADDAGKYANFPNKASTIRKPAQTIVFADSRGAGIPHGEHAYLVDPPKMGYSRGAGFFSPKDKKIVPTGGAKHYSPADTRHLGVANVAFLDSHAESMDYEQMGYGVDPETDRPVEKGNTERGGPGDNRLWTGTGRDEPDVP